jgi:hypothetical protein
MNASKWTNVVRWSLGVALTAGLVGPAWADDAEWIKPWTSVGSAGTIHPAHLGNVAISGPNVLLNGSDAFKTAIVNYNVVAVDGLYVSGDSTGIRLRARYLDPGNGWNVTLRLYERNIATGASKLLLTLNSDSFPQSSDSQAQEVSTCENYVFDFSKKAYYVAAVLKRDIPSDLAPQLTAVQVASNPCIE